MNIEVTNGKFEKVEEQYLFELKGHVENKGENWEEFTYQYWFNKEGKKVSETVSTKENGSELKRYIRSELVEQEEIEYKSNEIKLANRLEKAKREDIEFRLEYYKYKHSSLATYLFKFEINFIDNVIFTLNLTKDEKPKIYYHSEELGNIHGNSFENILSKEFNGMIVNDMLSRTQQKITLMIEGFQFH